MKLSDKIKSILTTAQRKTFTPEQTDDGHRIVMCISFDECSDFEIWLDKYNIEEDKYSYENTGTNPYSHRGTLSGTDYDFSSGKLPEHLKYVAGAVGYMEDNIVEKNGKKYRLVPIED